MTQATVCRYPKGMQFFDNSGKLLSGGTLFYFSAGTSTPQTVYLDSGGVTPYSSGSVDGISYVQLNSAGRLENPLYLGPVSNYKELLTDYTGAISGPVGGNTIAPWPEDNIPAAPTSDTTQQVITGTLRGYIGTVEPSGYVFASGRSVGNPSSSATGRANSDTQALFVLLWNSDLTNTYFVVAAGRGSSALADFSANKTITLPDLRGRAPIGLDNMGGTDAGRLDWTNAIGYAGGEQYHTLTATEMPVHNHNVTDPGHSHTTMVGRSDIARTNDSAIPLSASTNTYFSTGSSSTGITIQNAGSGGAHNNLQPSILLNWIVKL